MTAEQFETFFAAMNAASEATKIAAEFLVGERNIGNESLVGGDNSGVAELYLSNAAMLRRNAKSLIAFADMIEARADEVIKPVREPQPGRSIGWPGAHLGVDGKFY